MTSALEWATKWVVKWSIRVLMVALILLTVAGLVALVCAGTYNAATASRDAWIGFGRGVFGFVVLGVCFALLYGIAYCADRAYSWATGVGGAEEGADK